MRKIPKKYVPSELTNKDKRQQIKEINKSREDYKKGEYHSRPKVDSFKSKKSKHVINAQKVYNIKTLNIDDELSKKTGCSIDALEKIFKKGQGAYYSSGSRPNQTAHSWGIARVASAITGGKAAAVDWDIIEEGCDKNAKAYRMALDAKENYGPGRRKTPKID